MQQSHTQTQDTEYEPNISGSSILSQCDLLDQDSSKKLLRSTIEKLKGDILALKQLKKGMEPLKSIETLKIMVVNSIHLKNCLHLRNESFVDRLESCSESERNKEALNSHLDDRIQGLLKKLSDPKLQEIYNRNHPQYKIKEGQDRGSGVVNMDMLNYLVPRYRAGSK